MAILRERQHPPPGHGFKDMLTIEYRPAQRRDGDSDTVLVVCHCGWQGLSVCGTDLAWHELRVHYSLAGAAAT